MGSSVEQSSGIAILDFSLFLNGSEVDRQHLADQLLESFKESGFVYLMNHGVPQEKVDSMFDWSKQFFALPMDVKLLAPHPPSGTHHRGYSAPGVEKVSQHIYAADEVEANRLKAPDVKESFESGREDDPTMPNIWLPEDKLPGFKDTCQDFYWTCYGVELIILRALAVALHLPEDYFTEKHKVADNQLRLLHYPSVSTAALRDDRLSRIDAHSDYVSITLLFQDSVGGLEIEDPEFPGTFKSATPVPGAMIVNAGDLLARWSNDTIRSTIHRVRAPPDLVAENDVTPERYSIPYFCTADFDTVVECIPGTWDEEWPKKYEPISARQYVMKRLAASY